MSLIGLRGGLINNGYTLLGNADVDNAGGATDTFDVPNFTGAGTPQVEVVTAPVGQSGVVGIKGDDATDLYASGEGITSGIINNVTSITLGSVLTKTSFLASKIVIRSGALGVINFYRLVCIGNGTSLSVYIKKEF